MWRRKLFSLFMRRREIYSFAILCHDIKAKELFFCAARSYAESFLLMENFNIFREKRKVCRSRAVDFYC